MKGKAPRPKLTHRSDVLYFCQNCGRYSWRTKGKFSETKGRVLRAMWPPEGWPKAVNRTCNTCRANNA